MVIPLKVLNRLRAGKEVAAQVAATRPQYKAWVCVKPMLDPNKVILVHYGGGLSKAKSVDGSTDWAYLVRHIEMHEQYMEYLYESEAYLDDSITSDHYYFARSEDELPIILSKWLSDFATLREPLIVHCPDFPNGMIPELRLVDWRNQP